MPLARSCALCALRRCIPVRDLRARSGVLCRRAAAYSAAEDVLCLPAVDATRFQDVVERDDLLLHLLHGQRHDGCSFWDWLKRFAEASLGCEALGCKASAASLLSMQVRLCVSVDYTRGGNSGSYSRRNARRSRWDRPDRRRAAGYRCSWCGQDEVHRGSRGRRVAGGKKKDKEAPSTVTT